MSSNQDSFLYYLGNMLFGGRNSLKLCFGSIRSGEGATHALGYLIQFQVLRVIIHWSGWVPGFEHGSIGLGMEHHWAPLCYRHEVEQELHHAMAIPHLVAHPKTNHKSTAFQCRHLKPTQTARFPKSYTFNSRSAAKTCGPCFNGSHQL